MPPPRYQELPHLPFEKEHDRATGRREAGRDNQDQANHQGHGNTGDHVLDRLPAKGGVLAAEPITHIRSAADSAVQVDPQVSA